MVYIKNKVLITLLSIISILLFGCNYNISKNNADNSNHHKLSSFPESQYQYTVSELYEEKYEIDDIKFKLLDIDGNPLINTIVFIANSTEMKLTNADGIVIFNNLRLKTGLHKLILNIREPNGSFKEETINFEFSNDMKKNLLFELQSKQSSTWCNFEKELSKIEVTVVDKNNNPLKNVYVQCDLEGKIVPQSAHGDSLNIPINNTLKSENIIPFSNSLKQEKQCSYDDEFWHYSYTDNNGKAYFTCISKGVYFIQIGEYVDSTSDINNINKKISITNPSKTNYITIKVE